ncbi:ABC transporter permease [Paenibacillus sp. J5C_2022]|uniref:ABC transporter permease n=1 Tax=Paenibacillus sp. J5C2022 TaxID=2977129 RepID=UPI0021D219ED|nr:ABC transporter permease [Paenibacillus sp. J5C2022]MCU6709561.1 ABC transporter permease [Paenibacillus sp. J5C2022]
MRHTAMGLERNRNERTRAVFIAATAAAMLLATLLVAGLTGKSGLGVQLELRNLPPSLHHPFGTDWLGRDMLVRTFKGLALSIGIGMAGALFSAIIATAAGLAAATLGKVADRIITWLMDVFMSVPHLVLLILIAFLCGGGMKGIAIGIMATHWPALARVIRAEAMSHNHSHYVAVSRKLGRSRYWIMSRHLLPGVLPQVMTGLLLLFPHAVLHEAAITFLGLGLPPSQPAIGIILSESMRYLTSGMWWLALFPGLCLLATVRTFDALGQSMRRLIAPGSAQL